MGLRSALRLVEQSGELDRFVVSDTSADVVAAIDTPIINTWTTGLFFAQAPIATIQQAMSVPSIARGMALISGTLASLPLHQYSAIDGRKIEPSIPLLYQPDPGCAKIATYAYTFQSLILRNIAYWQVLSVYEDTGRPREARYVDASRVVPRLDPTSTIIVGYDFDGAPAPSQGKGSIIQFDGLDVGGGLLTRAGRTIQTAVQLENSALRSAEEPVPQTVLKNSGVDLPADKVSDLLAKWKAARQQRATAYLSNGIELEAVGFDPQKQQLVEARTYIAAELARAMNLDPYWVGAATNSMTYSNVQQEREALWRNTLAPLADAVSQRLSMPDITARGTEVRFDLSDYLRADALGRANVYEKLIGLGIITADEARAMEDLAPRGGTA